MNNTKIPKLRFPGFEGEWEEKKLGEVLEERNEQHPINSEYPLMAFIANKGVANKGERYDRSALVKDVESKKYKRTKLGDFIYSSNNLESGSIGMNTYGNASISPVYSIFSMKPNCNAKFMSLVLTQRYFINKMIQYRQGVVYGQWKIPESEFLKLSINIPNKEEQEKIADFLSSVDEEIEMAEKKLEGLKEH